MVAGTATEIAIGEFLDAFYTADRSARAGMLTREPPAVADSKLNALVAAIAEHLAKGLSDEPPAPWVGDPSRFLADPWFTARSPDAALREYLTCYSPAAFKRRNIMTDPAPLRRATTPSRPSISQSRLP